MKLKFLKQYFLLSIFFGTALCCTAQQIKMPREIILSKKELQDKIKGGWAGQVIGCTYGGPTEFQYLGRTIADTVTIPWNDQAVSGYYDKFPGLYDDIYMDLTFVEVIDKYGVDAPASRFAEAFAGKGYQLWAANQMGRYNVLQGIKPPESGHWTNNPHADDIDFQIESDFIGLMYPGMPASAAKLADKVGHIMNYGDGWYGGVFVSTMYTLAFTSKDVPAIINQALTAIPEQSDFYQCIADIIKWHKQYPQDWRKTWQECERKWSNEVGSPDGVLAPYNIDAKINSAYVVMGLLYGQGDFFNSIDIATRCGQDSDCNPSTVAGILGTIYGYDQIPEKWKAPLTPVLDRNFDFTGISLNGIYDIGYKHALTMIKEQGGKIGQNDVLIKTQKIKPVRYEKSFEGHYPIKVESLLGQQLKDTYEYNFEGIGLVFRANVEGPDNYDAKIAFSIDDKLIETATLPAKEIKRRYEMFYKYQLPNGKHKLTAKWLNPKEGVHINLYGTVTYGNKPLEL